VIAIYEDKWVFLAHSIALEREAADRIYELAETMEVHNNPELHKLFTDLATYSEKHAANIDSLCAGNPLPDFKAWEYSWPGEESPEIFHYANVHYLMTVEEALQTALKVEQSAEVFYRDISDNSTNPEIKEMAVQFAAEEREHAQAIIDQLSVFQTADQKDSPNSLDQTDFDPPHMPE
jgi:rubrerythrin